LKALTQVGLLLVVFGIAVGLAELFGAVSHG